MMRTEPVEPLKITVRKLVQPYSSPCLFGGSLRVEEHYFAEGRGITEWSLTRGNAIWLWLEHFRNPWWKRIFGPEYSIPVVEVPEPEKKYLYTDGVRLEQRIATPAAQPKPLAWPKIDPDRLAESWIGGV